MLSFQFIFECRKIKSPSYPEDTRDIKERRAPYVTCLNGSLSLEASIVLPLFIGAVVMVIFFIQAIQMEMRIQKALYNQILKSSGYAYFVNIANISDPAEQLIETEYVRNKVINEVGKEYLDNSYIIGGSKGIYANIFAKAEDGILDISLIYKMNIPFNIFKLSSIPFVSRIKVHTWIGKTDTDKDIKGKYVYVTPNGQVFHLYKDCSYIYSKIENSKVDEIDNIRNESGGKYYPCVVCTNQSTAQEYVFYTKYGIRYHSNSKCRNLYSNIYCIDYEIAKEKYRLCSKCEKRS